MVYDGYMVQFMMSIWYGIRWAYRTFYDEYMVRYMMGIWYNL